MRFVSCQCSVKYSLSVLKCTLTTSYGLVFLCSSLLGQPIRSLRIRNERTYVRSRSYDPVECLAEAMQSEIYPLFRSFGTLDHFEVDCKAEESTRGQHLVIMMMDTSIL